MNPDDILKLAAGDLKSAKCSAILDKARDAIHGPRQHTYGDPGVNVQRTADLWSTYLGTKITARDVCLMSILVKCSRDAHNSKEDNLIDIAGYAEIAGMLAQQQEPKQ